MTFIENGTIYAGVIEHVLHVDSYLYYRVEEAPENDVIFDALCSKKEKQNVMKQDGDVWEK